MGEYGNIYDEKLIMLVIGAVLVLGLRLAYASTRYIKNMNLNKFSVTNFGGFCQLQCLNI